MTSEDRLSRIARAGSWLREQRQRRGFRTAAEFGRAIGVSKELVSNYEVGRSSVPEERVPAIAEALGLNVIDVRRGLGLWVPEDEPPERTAEEELDRIRERLRTPGGRAALRSAIAGLEAQLRVTEDPEERSTLRRLIHRLGGPLPHEPEPDVTKDDKEAG